MKLKRIPTRLKHELKTLKGLIHHRINPDYEMSIVDEFHRIYVSKKRDVIWLGTPVLKCPFDLWMFQEIIFNQRPNVIITDFHSDK